MSQSTFSGLNTHSHMANTHVLFMLLLNISNNLGHHLGITKFYINFCLLSCIRFCESEMNKLWFFPLYECVFGQSDQQMPVLFCCPKFCRQLSITYRVLTNNFNITMRFFYMRKEVLMKTSFFSRVVTRILSCEPGSVNIYST